MQEKLNRLERLAASHREASIAVNGNIRFNQVAQDLEDLLLEYKCLYMRPTVEELQNEKKKVESLRCDLKCALDKIELLENKPIESKRLLDNILNENYVD